MLADNSQSKTVTITVAGSFLRSAARQVLSAQCVISWRAALLRQRSGEYVASHIQTCRGADRDASYSTLYPGPVGSPSPIPKAPMLYPGITSAKSNTIRTSKRSEAPPELREPFCVDRRLPSMWYHEKFSASESAFDVLSELSIVAATSATCDCRRPVGVASNTSHSAPLAARFPPVPLACEQARPQNGE